MALTTTQDAMDALPLFAAARRTDPGTSHEAAKTAPVAEHQRLIMDALGQGPAGASGIAARCGLSGHQVNKRLTELARTGRIVETGRVVTSSSGRGEREWKVSR